MLGRHVFLRCGSAKPVKLSMKSAFLLVAQCGTVLLF